MKHKYTIIIVICTTLSIIFGIIAKDLLIGGTILMTGLLYSYFASERKRDAYIFGLINYILMGYVSFKNNLYGIFIFYIFIFTPLQIQGLIAWNKNLNDNNDIKVRKFHIKDSIIIILCCIIGSFILGYFLSFIPNQRLAILDASSNCINLISVILMILRFKEAWWLWLANNILDLVIWIIITINKGEGSIMMLLTSISYLLINIYGIIKWNIESKKNSN